jgi:hypothetical protein
VLTARADRSATKRQEAGCCVLLTHVPKAGALAPSAGDVLKASQEPQGVAQHVGFRKDPGIVNSLFRKQPERLEALGRVF